MASKRRIRRKVCGRKVRYATQADAQAAIITLTRSKGWLGYMVPYRCQFCGGFHFGHPPRRVRNAMGARAGA